MNPGKTKRSLPIHFVHEKHFLPIRLLNNQKKFKSLKGGESIARKKKTMEYLLQKGFEWQLITQALAEMEKK